MRNLEIADTLRMIADILEINGENPFKVRAYRQAVLTLETLPEEASALAKSGKLAGIPGIGRSIAEKIEELVSTGRLEYYENLRKSIPEGLVEMLEIPNVGPKTVHVLFKNLGIQTIDELEKSASEGRIRNLKRFGEKTEQNILRGIRYLKSRSGRMLLGSALGLGEAVLEKISAADGVEKTSIAGSLRRMKESIGDIDILAASKNHGPVMEAFLKMPEVTTVLSSGGTRASVILENRVQADLRVVPPESYGAALQYFTGSMRHNVRLRELAGKSNLKVNEYGVFDNESGAMIAGGDERGVYGALKLPFIEPELREDRGEIEAAAGGRLPSLAGMKDIRGDLHVHTDWSDGIDSISDIAGEAIKRGYEYIAVCDHSGFLKVAGGLTVERKLAQAEEIRKLNGTLKGFRVLSGAEVDILADGSLDYPDEILEKLDIVIAAVHTGFSKGREEITRRVLKAMNNSHVNIIAHPTGRLINQREPYQIDMNAVMDEAARTGTFLELNCFPNRLDINDILCREAKSRGVKVALGSDCHNRMQLDVMKFGVGTARRGWLSREDVVNAASCKEIEKMVAGKRKTVK